jgi:hypothetical protein
MTWRTSTGGLRASFVAVATCLVGACDEATERVELSAPRPAQVAPADVRWNASTEERLGTRGSVARSAASEPLGSAPGSTANASSNSNSNSSGAGGGGLRWSTPAGWSELPTTALRVANFRVGDDERAECYLTLLAGNGGGLAANVNRWRAQMGLGALSADEVAKLPRKTLLGADATLVDLRGSFSGMGGAALDDARLVGLLAIGPQGAAFLKMTGPSSALENQLDSFLALAASLQP